MFLALREFQERSNDSQCGLCLFVLHMGYSTSTLPSSTTFVSGTNSERVSHKLRGYHLTSPYSTASAPRHSSTAYTASYSSCLLCSVSARFSTRNRHSCKTLPTPSLPRRYCCWSVAPCKCDGKDRFALVFLLVGWNKRAESHGIKSGFGRQYLLA